MAHIKFVERVLLATLIGLFSLIAACAPTANTATLPEETEKTTASEADGTKSIQLTDGLKRSVTLPSPAQRVISLAPSSTEILFALGAGSQIVGRDTFSDYPEEVKAIPDIGGGFGELNLETILAQEPDLVLGSSLTPVEQIQALEKANVTVFASANPNDFAGLFENIRTLAILVGKESAAEALIADMEMRKAAVETTLAGVTDRPLVFYELDGTDPNAVWTPGPGTFIDTLIHLAGADNLGKDLSGDWVQVSLEELISRDPDLILLGDATWGGVTVESIAARAGWESLTAVKNGRVYPFDDNLVSRPGPRLIEGLEALARQFHPDLFQ